MNKIFGIGWAKTGTTTLGNCFKILGFDHQSQDLGLVKDIRKGDLSRIMALAEKKETFEDWPWILLYEELDKTFPNSRFVLTKRKSEKWIRSYKNMIGGSSRIKTLLRPLLSHSLPGTQSDTKEDINEIRRTLYGLPFPEVPELQLIERYEKHNADVEHYFRGRSKDLLIVDWEEKSGWQELCDFLGKDIPDEPFPHANKGKYSEESAITRRIDIVKNQQR